jgi:hypothetical protein
MTLDLVCTECGAILTVPEGWHTPDCSKKGS